MEERLADNAVLYIAVNFAGMYTKYLTDRGQRKAFLETHRSMETRCRTQKENDRQEKLLLSGECESVRRFGNTVTRTAPCALPFLRGFSELAIEIFGYVKMFAEVRSCDRELETNA